MNPQTNSAFQCGDENGYKVLNAMAEEPCKSAYEEKKRFYFSIEYEQRKTCL